MSKAKKLAPSAPVPQTDALAAAQLAELGDLMRAREAARARAETEIAALQAAVAAEDAPLAERASALTEGLRIWAEAHRARLTRDGATKTVKLQTGVVQWRSLPPKVAVARGQKEAVIAALEAAGLEAFLRRKVDLNKEAILEAPFAAVAAAPGLEVASGGEEFIAAPDRMEAPRMEAAS